MLSLRTGRGAAPVIPSPAMNLYPMRHSKVACCSALLAFVAFTATPLSAQAPAPSPTPAAAEEEPLQNAFILFTILKKPVALQCTIGTNSIVDAAGEPVGAGFSSGLRPWRPAKDSLRAEAKGYQSAELKPFLQIGEIPIVVLQERSSGSLGFSVIKNATSRDTPFYDAINLSSKNSLAVTANGKKFRLPRSQRMRLTAEKKLDLSVEGGGSEVMESPEDPSYLVVFFDEPGGKIGFRMLPDMMMQ